LSSILRALKKLDEDSVSREGQTNEQKIKMKRMVDRRANVPRKINRVLSILSAVLLVGTAALILMNVNREHPVTKKQDTITKEQDTPARERPLKHSPQQSPGLKKELKEESPKESPKESTPPAAAVEQPKPSTIPTVSGNGRPHRQPMRREEYFRTNTGKEITPKTLRQQAPVKQNKHPEIILNGVLWSDIPQRRVALINNRYLKEGDQVDGVSIIQIKKKSVTLQYGEEKWTVTVKK
jgi:hypothetical protein